MDFHKGCQIENCLRYFLYLTKQPIRHLNIKVPAFSLHDSTLTLSPLPKQVDADMSPVDNLKHFHQLLL